MRLPQTCALQRKPAMEFLICKTKFGYHVPSATCELASYRWSCKIQWSFLISNVMIRVLQLNKYYCKNNAKRIRTSRMAFSIIRNLCGLMLNEIYYAPSQNPVQVFIYLVFLCLLVTANMIFSTPVMAWQSHGGLAEVVEPNCQLIIVPNNSTLSYTSEQI
jgi:hypothetical protein